MRSSPPPVQLAAANMICNVPACMIDEQVDHQIEQFAYQLQSQGMKMEDYTKMIGGDLSSLRQSMRPMAEQTVRSDILLSEIARAENLEVTDEEVEEELKKLAEQYQMELDKVKAAVDTAAVKSDLMGKKAAKIITDQRRRRRSHRGEEGRRRNFREGIIVPSQLSDCRRVSGQASGVRRLRRNNSCLGWLECYIRRKEQFL